MHEPQPWKRPESVLVVVYTAASEVLLLERTEPVGYWQSVTGSLRWDETPVQAAIRELGEETGLAAGGLVNHQRSHAFAIHPAWRHRFAPDVKQNIEHVFSLCLPAPVDIRLQAREHRRYQWLQPQAALAQVCSASNRDVIAMLLSGAVER